MKKWFLKGQNIETEIITAFQMLIKKNLKLYLDCLLSAALKDNHLPINCYLKLERRFNYILDCLRFDNKLEMNVRPKFSYLQ